MQVYWKELFPTSQIVDFKSIAALLSKERNELQELYLLEAQERLERRRSFESGSMQKQIDYFYESKDDEEMSAHGSLRHSFEA